MNPEIIHDVPFSDVHWMYCGAGIYQGKLVEKLGVSLRVIDETIAASEYQLYHQDSQIAAFGKVKIYRSLQGDVVKFIEWNDKDWEWIAMNGAKLDRPKKKSLKKAAKDGEVLFDPAAYEVK